MRVSRQGLHKIASGMILVFVSIVLAGLVWVYHEPLWHLFSHRNQLKELLLNEGAWAPLAFMGLQALQVVIFVIPGEITQLVGGWLFGTWLGCLWSLIGITVGAALSFLLARRWGRRLVGIFIQAERLEAGEKLLSQPRWLLVTFLLFLIPGVPKDALCYVAGFSRVPLGFFLAISSAARFPALFLSSWAGSAAGGAQWTPVVVLGSFAVLAVTLGWVFRRRWEALLEKLSR